MLSLEFLSFQIDPENIGCNLCKAVAKFLYSIASNTLVFADPF